MAPLVLLHLIKGLRQGGGEPIPAEALFFNKDVNNKDVNFAF